MERRAEGRGGGEEERMPRFHDTSRGNGSGRVDRGRRSPRAHEPMSLRAFDQPAAAQRPLRQAPARLLIGCASGHRVGRVPCRPPPVARVFLPFAFLPAGGFCTRGVAASLCRCVAAIPLDSAGAVGPSAFLWFHPGSLISSVSCQQPSWFDADDTTLSRSLSASLWRTIQSSRFDGDGDTHGDCRC